MKRLALSLAVLALPLGCDSLVGGACVDGYEYVEARGECVLELSLGGGSPEGGGGQSPITSATGGGSPSGTTGTGTNAGPGGSGSGGSPPGCEPLSECAGSCVDLQIDAQNCGVCGLGCPTGICIDGACLGSPAGHLVVSGLDYSGVNVGSPTARILGNALALHPAEPLRIVVPTKSAFNSSGLVPLENMLTGELGSRGRSATYNHVLIHQVANQLDLGSADIVLVAAEGLTDTAAISAALPTLLPAAANFFAGGGVMVVLATPNETDKLDAFLAGFEPGLSIGAVGTGPFKVVSWTDALAVGVISPFLGQGSSASFAGSDPQTTSTVMETMSGEPILLHRAFAPN